MKCLSVCQPFADLILSGRKTVELRSWNTKFRGEFLVHAPQKIRAGDVRRLGIAGRPVTGAVLGKAEIYDVKEYASDAEIFGDRALHLAGREFRGRMFGFMLRSPKRLRIPIKMGGRLGFFDADIPRAGDTDARIIADIIEEEHMYRLVGHH